MDLWVPWVAAVEPGEAFDVSNGTAEEDHVAKVSLAEPAAGDLLVAASRMFAREPALSSILSIDVSRIGSEAELLASVLSSAMVASSSRTIVREIAFAIFDKDETARNFALTDIRATTRRNFEPGGDVTTLFFSRGVHALLGHRVTHSLWAEKRCDLALGLKTIFGRAFSTDIHPAARFGSGIWLDHGLGFVAGETVIVEDDVSIWHGVTLGSTLKDGGDQRHPRIRRGATIGADAIILGGVEIGEGSVVAAGSIVLSDVAPGATVAGVPARSKPRSPASFIGFEAGRHPG
jgi:serine O-acetyltransferase